MKKDIKKITFIVVMFVLSALFMFEGFTMLSNG